MADHPDWTKWETESGAPPDSPNADAPYGRASGPAPGEPALPSWERLEEIGIGLALVQSLREILLEPSATFRRMPRIGGISRPLVFLLVFGAAGAMVVALYNLVSAVSIPDAANEYAYPRAGRIVSLAPFRFTPWFAICMVALAPVGYALLSFAFSGLSHLMLMLLNGNQHPFETTYRTMTYVMGAASALCVVPCCGPILFLIWGIAVGILALIQTQETVAPKAAAAVIAPVFVCCFCVSVPAAIAVLLRQLFDLGMIGGQ
jgi:hypothetical protein